MIEDGWLSVTVWSVRVLVKINLNPFPNIKFQTFPNSKTLQTIILSLMIIVEVLQMGRKHCGKRRNCS